jgi:DNA-binding MarR family transcriptional regulator
MPEWTIITNHGLVLAHIWKNPQSTARELALAIKVTEWTVHRIVAELEAAGYIERQRVGRSNVYRVNPNIGLRHATTRHVLLGDLLEVLAQGDGDHS